MACWPTQRLAELKKEEAEAVRKLVEKTVESAQSKVAKLGSLQQWLFFLDGLLSSVPVGVIGNYAFDYLKAH
jgi:hypothetical protein